MLYANPRGPKFFEAPLPASTDDGQPIDWSGVVEMTITVRRPDGSNRVWSTSSGSLSIVEVGDEWVVRHTFDVDQSDLPFIARGGNYKSCHYHFDVDATVNGFFVQIPSFCLELLNDRACR